MKFTVEFYTSENGKQPVKDFLDSLDKNTRSKVLGAIEVLKEYGTELRAPITKSIGNGLFELRVKFKTIAVRNLFFFYSGQRIILTNGFIKKDRKLPLKEKKLALVYKQDWLRRFGK